MVKIIAVAKAGVFAAAGQERTPGLHAEEETARSRYAQAAGIG